MYLYLNYREYQASTSGTSNSCEGLHSVAIGALVGIEYSRCVIAPYTVYRVQFFNIY